MAAQDALAERITELFNSKRFSDVIIRCDDRSWYAHKSIICTQSSFFAHALEGNFQEAESGYVDLEGDDPLVVDAMLRYMYTCQYPDNALARGERSCALFNVQVFALAEKYFIVPLLGVAAEKFKNSLLEKWDADDFAEAVDEWSQTSSDPSNTLGNHIVNAIMAHRRELMTREKQPSLFRDVIHGMPWLSSEISFLLSAEIDACDEMVVYRCPSNSCWGVFRANIGPNKRGKVKLTCPECSVVHCMQAEAWKMCSTLAPFV